jgi:3-oxocholest-4-en-26-oate---CoA ligase
VAVAEVKGIEGLKDLIGKEIGPGDWREVRQEDIDTFADLSGDHQWIHVDTERAASGPFGGTIAHGYLTLSMATTFLPEILETRGFSMGINYGCEKVRFPSPVPVGGRLRCGVVVDAVTDVAGGVQVTMTLTFEVEGQAKPACVATIVVRKYV